MPTHRSRLPSDAVSCRGYVRRDHRRGFTQLLRHHDGAHRLVLDRQARTLKSGGLQVLGVLLEGERAAGLGVHQHVDGEQRALQRLGAARRHHDVADGDPPAGQKRLEHLGEQFAVVPPRVLVANGAYPGEVGPAGKLVDVEVAGHERHPPGELRAGQPRAGLLDGVGQVEDRGRGGGHGAEKSQRPRPRRPAHVQQVPELRRAEPAHQIVGQRAGDRVHGGDETRPVGLRPADARPPAASACPP